MKEEKSHSFELEDVERYQSIEKALLMKELRRMAIYKLRNGKDGWVYYSSRALEDKFPYMAKSSIKRWLEELVGDGHLLRRIENKLKYDKTYSFLPSELQEQKPIWESVVQNGPSMVQNGPTIPPLSTPLSYTSETSVSHVSEDEYSTVNVDDWGEEYTPHKKKKDTAYRAVFSTFSPKYPPSWDRNTTQIKAAQALLKERGMEQITKAIDYYNKNKHKQFIPELSTPWDLDTKWEKLLAFRNKEHGTL